MSRRGLVNSAVALVAILVTGGLAVRAVVSGPSSDRSALIAAGIDGRDSVAAGAPATTADPIDSVPARSTPTTRPRPAPPTTEPAGSVTVDAGDPETALVTTPNTLPSSTPPPAPTVPPAFVRTSPSSWRLVADGVTVTASISPVAPKVGDTVTISYTMAGAGDFCCMAFVYVDGAIVGQSEMPVADCPPPAATTGTATVVVTKPGPFTFRVQGTRIVQLCLSPPSFATANLYATFDVLPA